MKKIIIWTVIIFVIIAIAVGVKFFSEESQNKFARAIGTTIGMKTGCVEVGTKRFLNVEKFSTAYGSDDNVARPYRYGYGYYDSNLNGKVDPSEKAKGKVYFEVSEYSQYIYFENK